MTVVAKSAITGLDASRDASRVWVCQHTEVPCRI